MGLSPNRPRPEKCCAGVATKRTPSHRGGLPPVQLPHLGRVHAPFDQQVAHAQRRHEMPDPARQLRDRGFVEMVVVVVREQHALDRRQLVDRDRRRVKALRPGPLHGRGALGEHRVGQPEGALELHQHRRVAEAHQGPVGRGQQLLAREAGHRQRRGGRGLGRLVEQHAPDDAGRLAPADRLRRHGIAEAAVAELRRIGMAGGIAAGAQSKRGHGGDEDEEQRSRSTARAGKTGRRHRRLAGPAGICGPAPGWRRIRAGCRRWRWRCAHPSDAASSR